MKTGTLQPGQCPNCGGCDLNYETCVHDGEELYFPFNCEDCSFVGRECYNLTWYGMTTEHGEEITIDHDN